MAELILETDRLVLRPRRVSDLEDCLAMDRSPGVTRFIAGPWTDPERHRAFIIDRMHAIYPDGMGYWTITAKQRPEIFLGWVLLLPYPDFGDEVEIGWRLTPACWGKGYATEAAAAVLDHAIHGLGLNNVVADIHPDNTASINVAEKLGLAHAEDRNTSDGKTLSYQLNSQGAGSVNCPPAPVSG